jgi:hypothetical protein
VDLNLTGQIWGMPIDFSGQISNPPIWNNAIIAAALSAILVSLANIYLNCRQNRQETKRSQLQIISQLEGRKNELLDLHMTLIQITLDCGLHRALRSLYRPDDNEEARVINDEYFRLRGLGDSLIVEISKSTARLSETLSH